MKSLSDVHVFNPVRHPDFALHRVRMEFKSPEVERRFQAQQLSQSKRSLRTALIFCGCFYLAFFATDVAALGFSRETGVLLLARLCVAATVAAGLYLVRAYPDSVACAHIAATTAEAAGMGVFMLIVLHRPNEIAMHAMSQCIMLAVIYILIPNRLLLSAGVALAATAGFIAIIVSIGTIEPSEALTMSMLLLLTNGFGLVAARRHQQLLRDQFRAH